MVSPTISGSAGLMEGKAGFDSSTSVWKATGWAQVDDLRKKLESLRELRDLVRQLGRAGGKGPLRKAPQEVSACSHSVNLPIGPDMLGVTDGLLAIDLTCLSQNIAQPIIGQCMQCARRMHNQTPL